MSATRLASSKPKASRPSWTTNWVRPADWLTMPTLTAGEQKVVGIVAIYPHGVNNLAFTINGNYTVDWGDGSAPANFTAGTKAEKNITYASAPSNTLTSEGHRQVIVTITPQSGQTLTSVQLISLPTGFAVGYLNPWRDVAVAGSLINSLTVSGITSAAGSALRWFTYVGTSQITGSMQNGFRGASQLRGLTGTQWTSGVTNMSAMFTSCGLLQTVPAFDTSACLLFAEMFNGCANLKTVPLFNTSQATTTNLMFNGCSSLVEAPALDIGNVTGLASMFSGCLQLVTVPAFNTTKVTNANAMFNGCVNLRSVPAMDLGNATDTANMFSGCSNLESVPLFTLPKASTTSSMFSSCTSLRTHPGVLAPLSTNWTGTFNGCSALQSIGQLDTTAATTIATMFQSCNSLITVPALSCANVTAAPTNLSFNSLSLTGLVLNGLRFGAGGMINNPNQMSAAALDALYTSLGTASGAQTITVTGSAGVAGDNPAIATAKGWTVVGS